MCRASCRRNGARPAAAHSARQAGTGPGQFLAEVWFNYDKEHGGWDIYGATTEQPAAGAATDTAATGQAATEQPATDAAAAEQPATAQDAGAATQTVTTTGDTGGAAAGGDPMQALMLAAQQLQDTADQFQNVVAVDPASTAATGTDTTATTDPAAATWLSLIRTAS